MIKQEIRGQHLFLLEDFLSQEECQSAIAQAEQNGFEAQKNASAREEEAMLMGAPLYTRDLLQRWWQIVSPWIPATMDRWQVVGLQEPCWCFRYEPNQAPVLRHEQRADAEGGRQKRLTLIFYLNEEPSKGETNLYLHDRMISVPSRTGMAIILPFYLPHEEMPMKEQQKYVIRSYVLYERQPLDDHG